VILKGEETGSISDGAAFELLRKFANHSREVTAEASWRGESVVCKVSGVFSATAEAFIIKGSGSLTFDVDGVVLSSCKFNVRLARMSAGEAAMNLEIGIPFASVSLDDGTRPILSRIPT
jgi:hypothetical protein